MPVAGVDIAKQTFDVALLVDEKWLCRSFPNTSEGIQRFQRLLGQKHHVCLEATGRYGRLCPVRWCKSGGALPAC